MRRGIIGQKLHNQIEDNNNVRYSDTIAEITYYDNIRNTASIRFANPNSGSIMTADNIAVKIEAGGFTKAALSIGQKCWISFIGNNLLCPVITNLCDDLYYDNISSKKTNSDQGAYLVNNTINDIDISSIKIISTILSTPILINDYLNEDVSTKYSLVSKDYTNTESIIESRQILMQLDKYKASEEGITNVDTNSTIKFKENGDIDIFVNGNTGIRINPTNKNISFFAKTISTTLTDTWTINGSVAINGSLKINNKEVM